MQFAYPAVCLWFELHREPEIACTGELPFSFTFFKEYGVNDEVEAMMKEKMTNTKQVKAKKANSKSTGAAAAAAAASV